MQMWVSIETSLTDYLDLYSVHLKLWRETASGGKVEAIWQEMHGLPFHLRLSEVDCKATSLLHDHELHLEFCGKDREGVDWNAVIATQTNKQNKHTNKGQKLSNEAANKQSHNNNNNTKNKEVNE